MFLSTTACRADALATASSFSWASAACDKRQRVGVASAAASQQMSTLTPDAPRVKIKCALLSSASSHVFAGGARLDIISRSPAKLHPGPHPSPKTHEACGQKRTRHHPHLACGQRHILRLRPWPLLPPHHNPEGLCLPGHQPQLRLRWWSVGQNGLVSCGCGHSRGWDRLAWS
jgi:hypothetical protein